MKLRRMISFICVAVLLLEVLMVPSSAKNVEDVKEFKITTQQKNEILNYNEKFEKVAENDLFTLSVDKKNTNIALLDKNSKTTYYKDVDIDEYKKIFEETMEKINYIYNYYMDVINIIESKIYMSPSEYLIARNISKIFSCIYFCKNELEQWYEIVKNEKRKRVVTLHNNLKLDNIIRNKSVYLIGWEYSKIDSPIYDFINFYNNYALYFDFRSLLNEYERIFPFKEEEKKLLSVLISIPSKIPNTEKEYNKVKNVRQLLDKIYKTELLLTPKEKEETKSTQK